MTDRPAAWRARETLMLQRQRPARPPPRSGADPIAATAKPKDAWGMVNTSPTEHGDDAPRLAPTSATRLSASPAPAIDRDQDVDVCGADSFPASDAPSWWSGR